MASVHTLLWADLDGDGKAHELITGKRVYAHEIEPGATDGSLDRLVPLRSPGQGLGQARDLPGRAGEERPAKGRRSPGSQGFPPGTAGTGLQLTAIDIDGDGDLDLVCPGKSGLYLFENLGAAMSNDPCSERDHDGGLNPQGLELGREPVSPLLLRSGCLARWSRSCARWSRSWPSGRVPGPARSRSSVELRSSDEGQEQRRPSGPKRRSSPCEVSNRTPKQRADPAVHLGDLYELRPSPLPAVELEGVRVVDIILLRPHTPS